MPLSERRYLESLRGAYEDELEHERGIGKEDNLERIETQLAEVNEQLANLDAKERAAKQPERSQPEKALTKLERLEAECEQLALDTLDHVPGAREKLTEIDRQIEDLENDEVLEKLASKARARREKTRRESQRARAIEEMDEMLRELEKKRDALIAAAKGDPNPPGDTLEEMFILMRQSVALSHDLMGVTRDKKYRRPWDPESFIGPDLAAKMPALHPFSRKPKVPRPWAGLLNTVKEIDNVRTQEKAA